MHLPPPTIRANLARRGYKRSEAAIIVARYRRFGGMQNAVGSYSAHQLANLLGTSTVPVIGWIKKGWLKATPRGETVADHGGPGDRWMISPVEVRRFASENPALIGPKVDRIWLIDLLTNRSLVDQAKPAKNVLEGAQDHKVLPTPYQHPQIAPSAF
jgi:hypothetical protein